MKTALAGLCLAVILLPAANQAKAQAACVALPTLPTTITQPGNYCLTKNFTTQITAGTLVNIAANDVTLDCQGFTLRSNAVSATGSSSAIVALNRNNVTVKNCRVIGGFTHGINVSQNNAQPTQSYYNVIENNYIAGPFNHGIIGFGSAIEVRNNRVYDIGGQANAPAYGIRVGGSTASAFKFHIVQGNRVVGTNAPAGNAFGIRSDSSVGSVFHENLVSGTYAGNATFKSYAIYIGAGGANTITDNYLLGGTGSNDLGIVTASSGGWCHSNQIRVAQARTTGCDASLGNY